MSGTVGHYIDNIEYRAWQSCSKIAIKSANLGRALALPMAIAKFVQPIFAHAGKLGEDLMRLPQDFKKHAIYALGHLLILPFTPLIGVVLAVKTLFCMLFKPVQYSKKRCAKKQLKDFYFKNRNLNEQQRDLANKALDQYFTKINAAHNADEIANLRFPQSDELLREVTVKDNKLTEGRNRDNDFLKAHGFDANAKHIERLVADAEWQRFEKEVTNASGLTLDSLGFLSCDDEKAQLLKLIGDRKAEWKRSLRIYQDQHFALLGVVEPFEKLYTEPVEGKLDRRKLYRGKKKKTSKGKKTKKDGAQLGEVSKDNFEKAERLHHNFLEYKHFLVNATQPVADFNAVKAMEK